MKHFTSILAAVLVATTVSGAAAQAPASSAPSPAPAAPRVELGAGGAWFLAANAPGSLALVDTRATLRLTRKWDIEGDVALRPADNGYGGIYRIQARWRFAESAAGGTQAHLTVGGGGFFSRWSYSAYSWTDPRTGQVYSSPARTSSYVDAPMYPTVGVGVQKRLGDHLALRADLAAGFGISDYGIGTSFMTSVGIAIPVGHYPSASRAR